MAWLKRGKTEHEYTAERLSAYLDDELSPQERERVDRHLAACAECRWDLETLRQTVQWVQELPSVPLPRVFTLPASVQPERRERRRWGFAPVLQGATALVALLLVVVMAGDMLLSTIPLGDASPVPAVPVDGRVEVGMAATPAVRETADIVALEAPPPTAEMERRMEKESIRLAVEPTVPAEAPPVVQGIPLAPEEGAAAEAQPAERPPLPTATISPTATAALAQAQPPAAESEPAAGEASASPHLSPPPNPLRPVKIALAVILVVLLPPTVVVTLRRRRS